MDIWNSECAWDIMWLQDTIGFQDIYKKRDSEQLLDNMGIWDRDGKWLLDSMGFSDGKCVWNIIWLQDTVEF